MFLVKMAPKAYVYILLDVLLYSVAEYFSELVVAYTEEPIGRVKIQTTSKKFQ